MKSSLFTAVALLAAVAWSRGARADANDPAAAQALFDQGKKLMAEGKPQLACPKFAESQRLDPGVGTLLNLAACYETAGQTASAWSKFLEAESAARSEGNAEASRVAKSRAEALAPKLAKLVINVTAGASPADADGLEVRRDDVIVGPAQWGVPIPVDPGVHRIRASAPNHEPWETQVEIKGQGTSLDIAVPALAPSAAPPPPPTTVAPAPIAPPPAPAAAPESHPAAGLVTTEWLAIGAGVVGIAGVAIGSVFGLQSKSKHDSAEKYCDKSDNCLADGVRLRSDAIQAGNVSTVGFIVGGVGLAGAAVLWFTSKPASSGAPSASLGVGPGRVLVRGTF